MSSLTKILNKTYAHVKQFLDDFSFKFIRPDMHMFNNRNLIPLKDVKEIKICHDEYQKFMKTLDKGYIKLNYFSEKFNYIEIKSVDDGNYYRKSQVYKMIRRDGARLRYIEDFIPAYTCDHMVYFQKNDVEKLIEFCDQIDSIAQLACTLNVSSSTVVADKLIKNNIKILESGEHPFGKMQFYYKADFEAIKGLYEKRGQRLQTVDSCKYIDTTEAWELIGGGVTIPHMELYTKKFIYKNTVYWLREDIERFAEYAKEGITIIELHERFKNKIGLAALKTFSKRAY